MTPADRLRKLYALALLEGLDRRCPLPPVRPAVLPARAPRLDDTGRAPFVPQQPDGGGRG